MKKRYFITGTDTDVGKTKVTVELLKCAAKAGKTTLGVKPIAAGALHLDGQWRNDDALALMAAATVSAPYESVNPLLLREPMAPHLAAELEHKRLSVQSLVGYCRGTLMSYPADITLIEGAGGWRVPLNNRETLADVVKELQLDVILVVGMRLGCLNHALLTAEAIRRDGLNLIGWIANCIEPSMVQLEGNINTLQYILRIPLMGVLPYLEEDVSAPVNWSKPDLFE